MDLEAVILIWGQSYLPGLEDYKGRGKSILICRILSEDERIKFILGRIFRIRRIHVLCVFLPTIFSSFLLWELGK